MASLFIRTLSVLNIEAARALAREVEGEGRSAPPKELVETAPKPVKNAISKEDASPKGEIRWTKMAHKQSGGSVSVPQNKTELGRFAGPDGWVWKRVAEAHDWAKAKAKAAEDGRWWVILEGGKLWGWSPPNARPLGEKSPEVSKEIKEPFKNAISKEESAEKPSSAVSSPGANALVEAAKKRKEAKAAAETEKPKRTRKATSLEVEEKKE